MNAVSDFRVPMIDCWWPAAPLPVDHSGPVDHPYPLPSADFMDTPVFTTFSRIARQAPAVPALVSPRGTLSYGEIEARARATAGHIAASVPRGGAVALILTHDLDIAVGYLACLAAGRVCLVLNAANPSERLAAILQSAAPAAILVGDGMAVPPVANDVRLLRMSEAASARPLDNPAPLDMDEPAAVLYTSGSTGVPKGVVRSQRQLISRAEHKIHQFHVGPTDRIMSVYALSAGPGVTAMNTALLCGAQLHVADAAGSGLRGVLDRMQAHGISIVTGIPQMLRTLLALPSAQKAFARVRGLYSASEATLRSDVAAWRAVLPPGCAIALGYGLTEGAPLMDWFLPDDPPGDGPRLPIGYPTGLFDFAITDANLNPVAEGEVGELWARGNLMSLGEWRQGRCVPGRLLPDPSARGRMILRTGDLVQRGPNGLFSLIGRADAMVKIRGNRVAPAEVEAALRQGPAVADAAVVVGRSDAGAELLAYVVAANTRAADRGALIRHLRLSQPGYMVPSRITFLPALPLLPNGKVDRMRLADPAFVGALVPATTVAMEHSA